MERRPSASGALGPLGFSAAKECRQVAAAVNNAYEYDPAWLLAVEKEILADRERKQIGTQILPAAAACKSAWNS
jgi:hypothetical protein